MVSSSTFHNGLRVVLVRDPHATDVQVTMRYGGHCLGVLAMGSLSTG